MQIARDGINQWQVVNNFQQQQYHNSANNQQAAEVQHATTNYDSRSSHDGAAAGVVIWSAPAPGTFKCNVDAAIFKEHNCYGAGMCLRDDKGNFIRA
ncbi:60S ribosomal protein L23 [Trifolium medium]|uniref:60S ribosomal protein L23 n=1 Tax=Trifolium medium TaxID=97028 RepID=A0A392QTW8_9FABA|nr:60S ribosomal protein L23 [Trifolium medium]